MDEASRPQPGRALEVFLAFLGLGFTAFGGPVAHLAWFRREFVDRRGWLSDAAFADLLALSHFLPGPASSQLGMSIGIRRAGLAGALAAWIGFTAPAAGAMIALAYLAPQIEAAFGYGWLHGLKIATAAVVIQALVSMARTLAVGPIRMGMALGATIGFLLVQGPVAQVCALIAGALFGVALLREDRPDATPDAAGVAVSPRTAVTALVIFAILLAALPLAAGLLQNPSLGLASVFYRTGALVFGGGHVVLPLLQSEVVGRGWLDAEAFISGYGVMQALPGPLFSFAGFIGASQTFAPGGWPGGLVGVVAIFLPSLLLVVGVLPFWDRLKDQAGARGALAGVNAVVVGLLAAALWNPVLINTVVRPADWALIGAAWIFIAVARLPAWIVVIAFSLATGVFLR